VRERLSAAAFVASYRVALIGRVESTVEDVHPAGFDASRRVRWPAAANLRDKKAFELTFEGKDGFTGRGRFFKDRILR
jgi:hypothetical protein